MATIQFNSGYTWNSLPPAQVRRLAALDVVIERLRAMREEWQESTNGEGLLDVKASVGLLLADICTVLDLDAEERRAVLGVELAEVAR